MQQIPKKKRFGQHFLVDKNLSARIAGSLLLKGNSYSQILEIGPGNGSLTDFLVTDPLVKLFLIEIDNDLIGYLKQKYPELKERIFHMDFLKMPFDEIFKVQTGIIGNFPYNISSQIVIKITENRNLVPEVVGMFQKEMAERITAIHGNKSYGRLSVMVQAFYNTEYLFTVSKNVFHPRPKVESAVIRMCRKSPPAVIHNQRLFYEIIKSAFGQRRKQVRNSLGIYRQFFDLIPQDQLKKRAEDLSVVEFIELANLFHQNSV